MPSNRRALLAAFVGGGLVFPAFAASAGTRFESVSQITEWFAADLPSSLRLAAYHVFVSHADAFEHFEAFATRLEGALLVGAIVTLGLALNWALKWRRGTGDLSLRLVFPEEIDGEFIVRLRRKGARKGRSVLDRIGLVRGPVARHTRHSVRRETQFDGIAPGNWFLRIEGTLFATESRARLARVDEELEVVIEANACAEVEQVLPSVAAAVEFRVHWDQQRARDVSLVFSNRTGNLRQASHGVLRTRLRPGRHDAIIGAGDRVVEQTVTISGYDPHVFRVDLAAPEGLIFKGCPPAVSPFMRGDLGDAARALERDGQSEVASLLLARQHEEEGQIERAAEQLENAGRIREAAEMWQTISSFDRAAHLFEAAGDTRRAAEMHEAAGACLAAARAYASLEAWGEAARCFQAAGDREGLIDALEGQGEILRAADLASECGDRARAIRLLQRIAPPHPDFTRASRSLSLAYENEGHLDLAARQLERCIAELAPGEFAPDLELHLSELLDASGEFAHALDVLESLRDRDPTYPGVAARIEGLRKKLSGPSRGFESGSFTPPSGATAFVAQERYELLEEIGRGGMGLVYKARDRRLARIVALKRMPETLRDHPTAVQLFLGEAQAAARMNHPNIVTLYDADQEKGSFFITMELLEGLPLNVILKQRDRFGPRDTARLGVQVCAGLQFAHDQGIVHRDIKTSNLFITRDRVLKIMDFGLAKILEAVRETGATVIAGTPFYMAPEQTAGNVMDGRTDLYALGVTLFELSTGCLPFADGDVAEKHRRLAPPDPRTILPDYPAELAELILWLMAKRPEDRPRSADEVAEALRQFIARGAAQGPNPEAPTRSLTGLA